MVEGGEVITR